MIQMQSTLNIADNSGAKSVQCIKFWWSKRKSASIGDVMLLLLKTRFLVEKLKKEKFIKL